MEKKTAKMLRTSLRKKLSKIGEEVVKYSKGFDE